MFTFFTDHKKVVGAMSTAQDGNMKLRDDHMQDDIVHNRKSFCDKLQIPYERVVAAGITHGSAVAVVPDAARTWYPQTDALVTRTKDLFLTITTADCFPVLLYDPQADVIGIAHAGWRGIVTNIVPKTITMMESIGANRDTIHMEIGPGISQNSFEFDFKEMITHFGLYSQDRYVVPGSTIGKVRVNLQQIILDQATQSGLRLHDIKGCSACTFLDESLYSARRHGGDSFSAMVSVLGMRSEA